MVCCWIISYFVLRYGLGRFPCDIRLSVTPGTYGRRISAFRERRAAAGHQGYGHRYIRSQLMLAISYLPVPALLVNEPLLRQPTLRTLS